MLAADSSGCFMAYLCPSSLTEEQLQSVAEDFDAARLQLLLISVPQDFLQGAPVTDRYPTEMYYRIFAAEPRSSERARLDWVRQNSAVIHYCGRNKPWKEHLLGSFDVIYREAEALLPQQPILCGLLYTFRPVRVMTLNSSARVLSRIRSLYRPPAEAVPGRTPGCPGSWMVLI